MITVDTPSDDAIVLKVSNYVTISDDEIEMSAIRAQEVGGQDVNKVATAIH